MTAKASLCMHLLKGSVLNVKNCFTLIGLTNCSREISRMIEQPFDVQVSRTPRKGKSRYGQDVTWFDFRLNQTEYNKDGIEKMKAYVASQGGGKESEQRVVVKEHTRNSKQPPKQIQDRLF